MRDDFVGNGGELGLAGVESEAKGAVGTNDVRRPMEQGSDKAQCGGGILCADVDGLAVDPACPVPEIARLGANPTQVEGRTRRLLRYRRSQQRLHGSHQRTLSSWADAPPEATATPPATNSECSASQEV